MVGKDTEQRWTNADSVSYHSVLSVGGNRVPVLYSLLLYRRALIYFFYVFGSRASSSVLSALIMVRAS